MESVSIVILNYNGVHYIKEFLPSVIEYSPNCQIHLVDNASTDDSIGLVEQEFPSVKVHSLESNLGFSKGYNVALQQVESEYYVILNSDVRVSSNWIEPILKVFEENDDVAAIQPKILSQKDPGKV